ncbi:MAG: YdcF family protein, partial [Pseudomonadota bacterium]
RRSGIGAPPADVVLRGVRIGAAAQHDDRIHRPQSIVLSGRAEVAIPTGRLRDPEAPPLGEAILFAERMKALGVAEDSIVLEPNARTTLENLTLSFALGDARGFSRYAVVTDAFHLPRALALAALIGRDVEGVATDGFYDYGNFHRVGLILRESMAWWYNLGKAVAWIGLGALGWSVHDRREVVF